MAGDRETAVMVMRMEEGLDTGPVCLGEPCRSAPTRRPATCTTARAARRRLMVRALAALERGTLDCTPQPADGVTYARKIDKAEARIDLPRPRARCTT